MAKQGGGKGGGGGRRSYKTGRSAQRDVMSTNVGRRGAIVEKKDGTKGSADPTGSSGPKKTDGK